MTGYGRMAGLAIGILIASSMSAPHAMVAAGPRGAPAPAAMCTPWQQLGTGRWARSLSDIVAMGQGTALAVGWEGDDSVPATTRHERWNGTRWRSVPGPADRAGELLAIARIGSSAEAWAVGYRGSRVRIERWNGAAWSRIALTQRGVLASVAVAPDGSTWAGGWDGAGRPLVMRRSAAGWVRQALPEVPGVVGRIHGIAARSATDVWAVGWRSSGSGTLALLLHRGSGGWSAVPAPPTGGPAMLLDVAAWGADAATAVGWVEMPEGQRGLVLDWDGAAWTAPPQPGWSDGLSVLADVARVGAATWAVGTVDVFGEARGAILRRTVSGWSISLADSAPTPLSAFARVGPGHFMAVGGSLPGTGVRVVVHCD